MKRLIAMKPFSFTALALALLLSSPAAADELTGQAKVRLQLERTLSAIEFVPSQQQLVLIHAGVDKMLLEIARGKTTRPLAQNRAITALRYFPGKEAVALLQELVDNSKCKVDDHLCRLNLQQALTSYAVLKGHAAVPRIAPFLGHAHMDLRMAAALALRLTASHRALPLMAEQITREKSATVRAEIEQQIRIMEGAERRVNKPRIPGK